MLAWGALTVLTALSIALFGGLFPLVRRAGHPFLTALGAAALWTSIDWVRGLWPLGGFTWGSLGASQVANPITVRLAVVAGVFGVTFAVAFAAALLAESRERRSCHDRGAAVVLVAVAALGPGVIPFAEAAGRPIDVAAIQVDFREGVGGRSREAGDIAVTRLNLDLHETLRGGPSRSRDLGRERARPRVPDDHGRGAKDDRRCRRSGGERRHVGGHPLDAPATAPLFNQAVAFDGGGAVVDVYRKTHLVPYGEYIPWKPIVGWISALEQIAYELMPGEQVHTLTVPGLPPFGTPICFENSFPALDREFVRQGARVPRRADEQRFLRRDRGVRAAPADVADPRDRGREMDRPCRRVGDQRVHRSDGPGLRTDGAVRTGGDPAHDPRVDRADLSVRLGDWLPIASLAIVIGLAAIPRSRRRERPHPGPLAPGARALVILPTYDEAATIGQVIAGVLATPASRRSSSTTPRRTERPASSAS